MVAMAILQSSMAAFSLSSSSFLGPTPLSLFLFSSGDCGLIPPKHEKSREEEGEQGQIIKEERPIHSSNVMLCSIEKEVASRVGHKILEDGTCVCYFIKTGQVIDSKEG